MEAHMPATGCVMVDGREIDGAEIAHEMQHHPACSLAEARRMATEALVLRRLLLDEAGRQGLTNDGSGKTGIDDPRIAALLAREIKTPVADEAVCRRYYENNQAKFRRPEKYDARHILIACAPDDIEGRVAAKLKAERMIAVLQGGPDLFGDLAIAYSACPSRNRGGRLGALRRGDTVPEFETYVFSLGEGELCPLPVETRYGVHVIALDRKIPGAQLPFAAVREQIAAYLNDMSIQSAVRQYLLLLAGRARIVGFEIAAAQSPLVQ